MLSSNVSPDTIKAQLNSESKINVSFIEDILDANHQALPKDLKLETGVSDIFTHNDAYSVVSIKSVIPKTSKSFKEAKGGHVIADFQEEKEKEWMSGLAKKYKVVINQEALNQVKEQLK